ncbi:hypothetical protein ACER0C_003006 [Sarotherodon galilaeus]
MSDSFIIGIDFGTAYSGYAFSLTTSGAEPDFYMKKWGKEFGLDTPKTPSCILFNEHEEFLKFGYEATKAYSKLRGENAKKHYFLQNFKLALYNKKLSRDVMIKAANGKTMKALKVFTESLRYLKEDALKTIAENTEGTKFKASDFTWVLTVPAIWDSSAKQFMREAATQAAIITEGTQENLIIALEPEAASIWCKTLPPDGFITQYYGGGSLDEYPGTQYIVVDCGGGTIDITVHEVQDGGALKELHKASGNDLGGQTVDRKFKEFLREIFSDGVWDEYEENFPSEVQKIMYDFMYFKQVDEDFEIICPMSLGTLAKKRQEIENFFETVKGASWDGGAICTSKETLRSFFAESLKGITDSLREILKKDLHIEYILLVGGYAESQILRQHVIHQFGDQCKVLCPFRPQEVITKGAVQFGRNPAVVAFRKSALTYGVSVYEKFDKFQHRINKKYTVDGKDFCRDIFRKLVEEGEDVGWDETREYIFHPIEEHQTSMDMAFYCTDSKYPKYVDDCAVKEIGYFHVDMPLTEGGRNRKVRLEITFGTTEIRATGTDILTGLNKSAIIDFITKT